MNEKQFEYLKKTYGKAFMDSIEEYDPSSFKEADFNQRARVNGNQQQNIGRYTRQFIDGVEQEIPVSMRGREIMEGISRVKAGQEAQKVKPEFRVKGTNFLHDVLGYTDEQWEDHQDSGNDDRRRLPRNSVYRYCHRRVRQFPTPCGACKRFREIQIDLRR
jgi:hypothetical protein